MEFKTFSFFQPKILQSQFVLKSVLNLNLKRIWNLHWHGICQPFISIRRLRNIPDTTQNILEKTVMLVQVSVSMLYKASPDGKA